MRRIVIVIVSLCLLAVVALPSGFALAQDASPSGPAAEPTAPPPPTQPPAQNLGEEKRFEQVILRPQTDRFDSRLHGRMGRHDHH